VAVRSLGDVEAVPQRGPNLAGASGLSTLAAVGRPGRSV